MQNDGKLIAAGTLNTSSFAVNKAVVLRYSASGALDFTYSNDGGKPA